jgi:nicotinamide-nucleotide amidase
VSMTEHIKISTHLLGIAEELGGLLLQQGKLLASAESCTGGGIAFLVTEIAGSSQWFERAFVTYSNQSKQQMLGVRAQTLEDNGAVSEPVVQEMVAGSLLNSEATIVTAVSGVAGPSGGSDEKPVGMVCFGWGQTASKVITHTEYFKGDRHEIRTQTIETALNGVIKLLRSS